MRDESARYETETQATAAPTSQQREQLQTSSRLKELAQRQQDVNDRLRELQTALQEARTEQEREEIRRQLKRLHEDERQMLADVDELRQRLAQSQNATSLAQQRQQLDQIRNDVRNASDQLDRESVSQALANGSRAQQNLQQLGDDFRRQTSSQFTDQMRQLRNQARDLAREQEDLGRKLEALDQSQHKTLGDESERQSLAQGLTQQQAGLTNLLAGMRSVTDQAESTEPLLARQLYDTLRRSDQSHTENLLDMGAQLVQRGFLPQAIDTERSARQNIEQLKQGVEQAAESVLGSETDALRYAQRELDELTKQVEREAAARQTNNSAGPGRGAMLRAPGENQTNQAPQTAGGETPAALGRGAMLRAPSDSAQAGATPDAGGPADNRGGGDGGNLEQMVRQLGAGGGGGYDGGPITGGNYLNWSDRLRDVEQVLDAPGLRNQVATVRERAAALRAEYRRNGRPPQLSVLQTQVVAPLTEVRTWLQQELARREGSDSLVPLDHDPVPDRYSDLVRRYYENLGSGQ
jgi:septal ring factor EnvC (AmiA/AmiB activator)